MTDFLTDAQRDVQVLAREFAAGEIAPRSAEWNRRHEVPVDLFRQMGDLGLLGIAVPEEYGGTDLDHVSYCLAVEAIAAADAGVSTGVAAHTGLAIPPLVRWGTDAQKGRWLPALVAGETIGAYALSEAEAGSDPASMRMSAKAIERGYVLDGAKQWITNAGIASFFVVFARTGEPGPRGISAFGIEPGLGLRVGAEIEKMGQHSSSTAEIAFEQMEAPVEALLGGEGEGLELALDTLGASRIAVAAQASGIAAAAIDVAADYARTRVAFGSPIGRFQGISFPLAEMSARLDAARLLMLHAARLKDADEPHGVAGAKAKLVATRVAVEACDVAVQTLGGYGYSAEYPVERYFRDAKVTEIYEGTSEIQRLVIARDMLGRL